MGATRPVGPTSTRSSRLQNKIIISFDRMGLPVVASSPDELRKEYFLAMSPMRMSFRPNGTVHYLPTNSVRQ